MTKYHNLSNMNFYEIFLNRMFFFVDFVNKQSIKIELNSLEEFYSGKKVQEEKIEEFLVGVNKNVPFYKNKPLDITQYPVVTKNTINKDYKDFISEKFNEEELIKVTTSGSYGTPMAFYRTNKKKIRQVAEVIYLGKDINYFVGRKHAFIRAISKSKINLLLQNEVHIDPTHLDDKSLGDIVNKIKKTKYLIGFPSVVLSIIKYCEKNGINSEEFNLLGIISTSEPLTDSQRLKIHEFFNCPVVARYATEELGIIGNQCLQTNNYHLNEASFIVEVLKNDEDVAAGLGEEGRIIVTDLYSNAMPLIRYDTGDLGVISDSCSCGYKGKVLESISGRKIQSLLDINGDEVSPFSINVRMKDYTNVYQFQFIQEDINEYRLLLVVNKSYNEESLILKDLQEILGDKANIAIEYVEEIPPLPSGKRPYIINKLKG